MSDGAEPVVQRPRTVVPAAPLARDGLEERVWSSGQEMVKGPAPSAVRGAGQSESAVVLLATLAALAIFLAFRLGPALLGFKTFSGVDLLFTRAPWNSGTPTRPLLPYITDNLDTIFPSYVQMHDRLFSGDIAWWSSLGGPGIELLGSPATPSLTPSTVWLVLLPTWWSLGFAKLLQILLAFTGMTLWLRRLGTTWAAGAIAGLLYVGSGFFTAWADWTGQATVAATVPALFWAIERFTQRRTARSALPIAAVVAFLMLGGFPAVAGHALYAGGIYFIVRLVNARKRHSAASSWATFLGGALAVGLGFALSAIQLLPQLKSLSNTDLSYRIAQFNAEQPARSFLSLFFPRLFNSIGYTGSNPIEAYAFIGFGALMLAGLAVVGWRWTRVGLGTILVLAITVALSAAVVWRHGFWTDWLRDVPIFNGNNSGRLRDMVALAGCALAGLGFNLLLRRDLPSVTRIRLVIAAWVMIIGAGLATVAVAFHYRLVISKWLLFQDAGLGILTMVAIAVALMLIKPVASPVGAVDPGTTLDMSTATTAVERKSRRAPVLTGAMIAVAGLIALQDANSVAYFWPLSNPNNFYPHTAAIEAAATQTGSQRAVTLGTFLGSTASAYGIRTVTAHTFQPDPWKDMVNSIDPTAYTARSQSPTNPGIGLPLTNPRLGIGGKLLDRFAANTIVAAPSQPLPGPLFDLAGKRLFAGSHAGDQDIQIATGSAKAVAIAPQNLRGVQVDLAVPIIAGPSSISLTATITGPGGKVLATGKVTRPTYGTHWVQIPIAGEKLGSAPGPLTLSIGVGQAAGPDRVVTFKGTGADIGAWVIGSQPDGLTEVYADETSSVWARTGALPRIRWATADLAIADTTKQLQTLADPATPDSTVVLTAPGPAPSGQTATLSTISDTGDRIVVNVDAKGAGYLVVADNIQGGWKAQVNGARAEIRDADHAFGAVFVPAGRSQVTFGYTGDGLKTGMVVTALSLIVTLAVYLSVYWTRRRRIERS